MRKILLLTFLGLLLNFSSQAQAPKIKFGKVSKEELLMKVYEKDSSADAVILSDIGNLHFVYNNTENHRGFEYKYTRHLRIKIFNKNAYNYANHEIKLRHSASKQEKITNLKAVTFNLENDKIEKSKISQTDLMRKEFNDYTDITKFTMPNVKEGSVIDIKYTIQSDYLYYLRGWQFQYDIPVIWSKYYVSVPEYFNYKHNFDGIQKLAVYDQSKKIEKFVIRWESERPSMGNTTNNMAHKHTEELTPACNVLDFAAKDVPAFKKEPFMASIDNYLFKVGFELSRIKYPNSTPKNYAKTWESVNKDLMNRSNFGGRLKTTNLPNNLVPGIINGLNTDEEKTFAIYSYVQNNLRWNEKYHIFPQSSLRSVLKEKTGSAAEMNMLLVVMLREAGINAHPVIASTRANGLINTNQPGYNQFNYTLAYALVNQKNYLMDATTPYSYPNFLPKRCLNGKARIVSENFTDWIDLNSKTISKSIIGCNLKLDTEANFTGKIQKTKTNYYACNFRYDLEDYESIDKYMEEIQNSNHNLEISDYEFKNVDSLHLPIKIIYNVEITEIADVIGEIIVFKPLNIYTNTENPFTAEERKYPINYTYPFEELYVMNYQIPEGYEVSELPSNIQVVTPDKSASFIFKTVQNGNIIQVTFKKKISKTFYMPSEYNIIKDFHNQIITKQNENIVLKKTI